MRTDNKSIFFRISFCSFLLKGANNFEGHGSFHTSCMNLQTEDGSRSISCSSLCGIGFMSRLAWVQFYLYSTCRRWTVTKMPCLNTQQSKFGKKKKKSQALPLDSNSCFWLHCGRGETPSLLNDPSQARIPVRPFGSAAAGLPALPTTPVSSSRLSC